MKTKYTKGTMVILHLTWTTFATKTHIRDDACKFEVHEGWFELIFENRD